MVVVTLVLAGCGDDTTTDARAASTTSTPSTPSSTASPTGGIHGTAHGTSDVAGEGDEAWSGLVVAVPSGALAGEDLTYGAGLHAREDLESGGALFDQPDGDGSFAFPEAEAGEWHLCVAFEADPVELLGCDAVTAPATVEVSYGEGGLQVSSR